MGIMPDHVIGVVTTKMRSALRVREKNGLPAVLLDDA